MTNEEKTLEGKTKTSFLGDIFGKQIGKDYYKGVILYGIVGLAIFGYFFCNAHCNKENKTQNIKNITNMKNIDNIIEKYHITQLTDRL